MSRVLLIDDDPSLLDALSMALEDAGRVVFLAEFPEHGPGQR